MDSGARWVSIGERQDALLTSQDEQRNASHPPVKPALHSPRVMSGFLRISFQTSPVR